MKCNDEATLAANLNIYKELKRIYLIHSITEYWGLNINSKFISQSVKL